MISTDQCVGASCRSQIQVKSQDLCWGSHLKFGNAGQVAIPTLEELLIANLKKFGNPTEISSFEKRNYECV